MYTHCTDIHFVLLMAILSIDDIFRCRIFDADKFLFHLFGYACARSMIVWFRMKFGVIFGRCQERYFFLLVHCLVVAGRKTDRNALSHDVSLVAPPQR